MKTLNAWFVSMTLVAAVACTSIGSKPLTLDQQIYAAYGLHTAVEQAAGDSLQSGSISTADGQQVLTLAQNARALLDAAKAVDATDTSTASSKLALASAILTQLQTYLNARLAK